MMKSIIRQEIAEVEREVKNNALIEYKKAIAAENAKFDIHITTHSGKLSQIPSVNTSSLTNPFCIERSKNPKSIYSKCYSNSLSKLRTNLEAKLIKNNEVLSSRIIPMDKLPIFNNLFVRFSSFGDLINMTHLRNLIRIAKKNPKVNFALWTKRTELIKQYRDLDSEYIITTFPSNLIIIYSNPMIDRPMKQVPKGFDKIFQVFSKPYIAENDQNINCGARSCLNCQKCYSFNDIEIINEVLK